MMITEENLDSDCREIHYVSENGRVEGLILDKRTPDGATRPRSAKGDRRFPLDGRMTRTTQDLPCVDVDSINNKGVHELFSDILYDSDTDELKGGEYMDDFEDDDDDDDWSDDSPHSTLTSRSENYQCVRPNNPLVEVPESPSIVSGMKYNEWQRNSGLRVLRKVLDRQKLLQTSDLAGSTSTSAQKKPVRTQSKRKPVKLQPLGGDLPLLDSRGRRLSHSIILSAGTGGLKGL